MNEDIDTANGKRLEGDALRRKAKEFYWQSRRLYLEAYRQDISDFGVYVAEANYEASWPRATERG